MLSTRRLPGIAVEVAPPPLTEALPRMDVGVFVGFASTGPLHVPVVVESVSQFARVFGTDARLAWDELRGEHVTAYLGPAVRAFFSNGGRRCWVIRVARTAQLEQLRAAGSARPVATVNRFAIPGVLEVDAAGGITSALAQARCEGSWSDALRVQTALSRQSFAIEPIAAASPPGAIRFRTRTGLRTGDLLELNSEEGVALYARVEEIAASRTAGGPYEVTVAAAAAFERIRASDSPPVALSGQARVRDVITETAAELRAPVSDETSTLVFTTPVTASLQRGHWVHWTDGMNRSWLRIDDIQMTPVFAGSPSVAENLVSATVTGPAWRELDPFALDAAAMRRAHLLTIDLRVDDNTDTARLNPLGLTPLHTASWWAHVADAEFYGTGDDVAVTNFDKLLRSDTRRFPLAHTANDTFPAAWIPLGVTPLFGAALTPLPQPGTALERDGLADFDATLFLDPELAAISAHGMLALAETIRYVRDDRRELLGLHAALSVGRGGLFNEASLIAIPDAVHVGWQRRDVRAAAPALPPVTAPPSHWSAHRGPCQGVSSEPLREPDFGVFLDCETRRLEAPQLFGPDQPTQPGAFRLTWTDAGAGAEYVLLEATQPDFSDQREVLRSAETEYVALVEREGTYYYQVYAAYEGEQSAGSEVLAVRVLRDQWVLLDPSTYGETTERECLAIHRAALRMGIASGDLFAVFAVPRHFRTQDVLRYTARLRAVNEPLVSRDIDAFDFTEARALSYGALYFPWLQSDVRLPAAAVSATAAVGTTRIVNTANAQPTIVPPDGAAAGVLAARASRRGAWVAAANQPYHDVVALTPVVPAADWQALQDAQINVVRAEPRGFVTLAGDTLAREPELRLINVRRLLILLRRVAVRRGHSYVFEPHGPALRRAVQRALELLLTDMFHRGAFAGATPTQSFRVVTDDTINRPADVAGGRFIVELRVAPSVPLSFITIRLAQTGERLSVSEEL